MTMLIKKGQDKEGDEKGLCRTLSFSVIFSEGDDI